MWPWRRRDARERESNSLHVLTTTLGELIKGTDMTAQQKTVAVPLAREGDQPEAERGQDADLLLLAARNGDH